MEKLIGDTTAISIATRESGEVIGKLVAAWSSDWLVKISTNGLGTPIPE